MIWVPRWLAKAYSTLYLYRGTEAVEFGEAMKLLGLVDKRVASKVLTQLRARGFLISRRDPSDPRRKLFRLIEPESLILAYAIQCKAEGRAVLDKLRAATPYLGYVVGGAYASHRFHGYATPGKVDIYVAKQDLGKWVALLTEPGVAVSLEGLPAEKVGGEHVHLHSILLEAVGEPVVVDGVRYMAPEALVVHGLRMQDSLSLTDSFALLIAAKDRMSWRKLLELAEREGVLRELGCTLELINSEAGKDLFGTDEVSGLLSKVSLSSLKTFPRIVETGLFHGEKEHYLEVGKRWNTRIYVPRAFVSKIVGDLVR